ncbi:MAG TPA: hypothetical protein VIH57_16615 [Bacteroidales bacterium]
MRRKTFIKYLKGGTLAIAFVLLQNVVSIAQQVNARLDSSVIKIGDQVKLHFDIEIPGNAKVNLPVFTDTISSTIEVVKTFPPDFSRKNGKLHIVQDMLITSFDSGYHQIPPIAFPYTIGQNKDTLHSAALNLTVNTIPVDTTKDFRDIKPPLSVRFSLLDYWMYIAGFFGLILIGFFIWFIIKLRKKEPLFGTDRVIEHPHVIALRELDVLRAEKLWQSGKIKPYYTKLTEIIRLYIFNRFQVNALEMTSEEIINVLKSAGLEDPNNIELIHQMFSTADLVKFAKWQPLPDENEVNLLNAYQFVNNTRPIVSVSIETTEAEEGKINEPEQKL